MSVWFSLNHGCVTALLALAIANLGDKLGSFQSGTLYVFYVLSALFFSAALVSVMGSKWALVSGVFLYSFYIVCFLVAASVDHELRWVAAITGAGIGGIAAGNIWTAQGSYFGETVALYTKLTGMEAAEVSTMFGGWFAFCYLFFEVACKLLTSLLTYYGNNTFIYTIFSIFAVCSVVGMTFIRNLKNELEDQEEVQTTKKT